MIREAWKSIAHVASHEIVHSNYSNAPYYEILDSITALDENSPYGVRPGDPYTALTYEQAAELAPAVNWACERTY